MKTIASIVVVGLVVFGCQSRKTKSTDQISGAYAREYSFSVIHPETGLEVGMRTVRDTIFIRPVGDKFEISNHKWMKNDYDDEGWKSMDHAEDRPMPTFQAVFDSTDGSLNSELMPHLFLDLKRGQLYKDKRRVKPYQKLR